MARLGTGVRLWESFFCHFFEDLSHFFTVKACICSSKTDGDIWKYIDETSKGSLQKKNQKNFDKCQNCSDPSPPPLNFDKKPFSFLCLKNTFWQIPKICDFTPHTHSSDPLWILSKSVKKCNKCHRRYDLWQICPDLHPHTPKK